MSANRRIRITNFSMKAGLQRRLVVIGIISATSVAAIILALAIEQHDLWVAISILAISLIGFHVIALTTYDCSSCWRAVDYPWVLATFMAILVALTNIYESARLAPLNHAISERRSAYDSLLYLLKSVITNDCHPKPSFAEARNVLPAPNPQACDRIEHFLPQIEKAEADESNISGLNSGIGWGQDIIIDESNAVGSWLMLYSAAHNFEESGKRVASVLEDSSKVPPSPIASWTQSNSLKYWYFALSFFLGLRLSKISAELMASRGIANSPLSKSESKESKIPLEEHSSRTKPS